MKEAVVLILDANSTMAKLYDGGSRASTRFDCAKQACQDMISDLMIRSKTNEVAVLVLKSPTTRHHFWEGSDTEDDEIQNLPFPNICELGGDGITTGVNRPHPDLLRNISKLEVTKDSSSLRGDFCDGIVVAADALFKKTSGKKYERRIVLITDAEHKVQVDTQQLLVVLDSLRAMECRLEIIGMDFEQQAEYSVAAKVKVEPGTEEGGPGTPEKESESKETKALTDDLDGDEAMEDNEEDRISIKRQNEQFLISLAEKTGGYVMAAKQLQPILQKVLGHRTSKSTRRKVQFQIAPGCVLEARFSLLLSKSSVPTLKKQVVELMPGERPDDPDAKVKCDALGLEVTHDITTVVTHWDPLQDTREITNIAEAYRYGSDLVPIGAFDLTGLIRQSPVQISIIGYLQEKQVPRYLRIGPPYALAGATSHRSCAAIAALARALRTKHLVGIATLVKTKDADPILVGLFPLEVGDKPSHLYMMQLPFQGEVTNLKMSGFTPSSDKPKQNVTDNLIDSFMLPNNVLDHTRTANPLVRSFHQTVVQRVLDTSCKVVSKRPTEDDPMGTPSDIVERGKLALEEFHQTFPLTRTSAPGTSGKDGKKKKGPLSYHDFLDE